MIEFTPGPWWVRKGSCAIVDSNKYLKIAVCGGAFDIVTGAVAPWDEVFANARLIAAAPELYEACKEVYEANNRFYKALQNARENPKECEIAYALLDGAMSKVRDALDKAEGKEKTGD